MTPADPYERRADEPAESGHHHNRTLNPIEPGPEPDTSDAVRTSELPDEVDTDEETDEPRNLIDDGDDAVEALEP